MDRREYASLASIGSNALLVALKLAGASLSGSVAMTADACHSASDIAVSVLVWMGIVFSRRRMARRRSAVLMDNGLTLVVAGAIFYAAFMVVRESLVPKTSGMANLPLAMGITLACVFISLFIARYKLHVGRETNTRSLIADGHHSRIDMYTSMAVLAVLCGEMVGIPLDRAAAAFISIAIAGVGVEVLWLGVEGMRAGMVQAPGDAPSPRWERARAALRPALLRARGFIRRRRRAAAVWAVLAVAAAYCATGISVVGPSQLGLRKRFGRFVGGVLPPGPCLHLPYPFDRVVTVSPDRVERLEFGYRTARAPSGPGAEASYDWENRHRGGIYRKEIAEALMLTGDENIVDVNLALQYRIADPRRYLTAVSDPTAAIRAATESSVRDVVGTRALDSLLTANRAAIQELIRAAVQRRLDRLGIGVGVLGVRLQDVHPPLEVVGAFRDVASAREEKDRLINEARGRQNEVVPRARGGAARDIAEAEAFAHAEVAAANGDTAWYLALMAAWAENPGLTRFRLTWETLENALGPPEKYFLPPDFPGGAQVWFAPGEGRRDSYDALLRATEQ